MMKDFKLYLENSVKSASEDYNFNKSDYSKGKNFAYFEVLKVFDKLVSQKQNQHEHRKS